jgi:purine-cytosine permease-like protein
VNKGKEDTPVNRKSFVVVIILGLALSTGLVASPQTAEAVLVQGSLPPATVVDAVQAMALTPATAVEDIAPTPSFAVQFPRPLPRFKRSPDLGKSLFDLNLIAMMGLNLADYLTTREALKHPGLEESNPLMKPFVKSPALFAAIKFGSTALTYWSMKSIFKKNRTAAWVLTTASNVLIGYVVANNLQNIEKAKRLR